MFRQLWCTVLLLLNGVHFNFVMLNVCVIISIQPFITVEQENGDHSTIGLQYIKPCSIQA